MFSILAGLLFARRLHKGGYVSIMDVFQQKYGDSATALLFLIHCISSLLYCAAILAALGVTFVPKDWRPNQNRLSLQGCVKYRVDAK